MTTELKRGCDLKRGEVLRTWFGNQTILEIHRPFSRRTHGIQAARIRWTVAERFGGWRAGGSHHADPGRDIEVGAFFGCLRDVRKHIPANADADSQGTRSCRIDQRNNGGSVAREGNLSTTVSVMQARSPWRQCAL